MFRCFFDPTTGDHSIIELNPRFGGGYPLSHAAGADLASAVIAKTPERVTWQPGVVMLRYDKGVFSMRMVIHPLLGRNDEDCYRNSRPNSRCSLLAFIVLNIVGLVDGFRQSVGLPEWIFTV